MPIHRGMRVLLVDDAPELVKLFQLILERIDGFVVTPRARDFDTLCDTVDWSLIDVAVVDKNLGGAITGLDILKWMEANVPHIRRILLTADDTALAASSHADAVLIKPIDATDLIDTIRGN